MRQLMQPLEMQLLGLTQDLNKSSQFLKSKMIANISKVAGFLNVELLIWLSHTNLGSKTKTFLLQEGRCIPSGANLVQ